MSKECGPSRDEGGSDGLAHGFRALARCGFGELADEPCSFFAPTALLQHSIKSLWWPWVRARQFLVKPCFASLLQATNVSCFPGLR